MERTTIDKTIDNIKNNTEIDMCINNIIPDLVDMLEELKGYKELEEQLSSMFGGNCTITDVVESLERQIAEPGKEHPVNARILTYEDAEKWNEYRELEEQGRLLKLPCKIGEKVYIPRCIEECKYDFECPFEDIEEWSRCADDEPCENAYKVYKIIEPAFELKMLANIGIRIFLTREEAENKLEEMKGE